MSADQEPSGASSVSVSPFAPLPSSRASPFPLPSASASIKNAMAASAFMPQSQPFRPAMAVYPIPIGAFDRDAAKPVGSLYAAAPAPASSVLIRRLPLNTSEESLRLMMVFSKELVDVEVLAPEHSDDSGFRSAILTFESPAGAHEARSMLDGKSNISNDAKMIVEMLSPSPVLSSARRYPADSAAASTTASSAASSVASSRQTSRLAGSFASIDNMSPPMNGLYGSAADLPGPEPAAHYQTLFSPQSPIGNHLSDRPRISGKSLINNDGPDDDETGELLKDPVAYAENGAISAHQRRATAPGLPMQQRLAALSLNTSPAGSAASMPPYAHLSAHPSMSPAAMNGSAGPSMAGFQMASQMANQMANQMASQHYRPHHNFPPVNPADQNPPCNTLYVGNLPIDTSEEELKAMFSKQRGYKRLCFRTKQNGPMCFVEFEDVSFATKALHELYGHMLHNSVKGGIRLSFSKNPLGVRSGQAPGQNSPVPMAGMMSGSANGFAAANGPPPGLSAPPGLGLSRMATFGSSSLASSVSSSNGGSYTPPGFGSGSSNGWGSSMFHGAAMATGGPRSLMTTTAGTSSGYPPFMMGK